MSKWIFHSDFLHFNCNFYSFYSNFFSFSFRFQCIRIINQFLIPLYIIIQNDNYFLRILCCINIYTRGNCIIWFFISTCKPVSSSKPGPEARPSLQVPWPLWSLYNRPSIPAHPEHLAFWNHACFPKSNKLGLFCIDIPNCVLILSVFR